MPSPRRPRRSSAAPRSRSRCAETVDLLLALGEAAATSAELAALVSAHCDRLVHADAEAAALVAEGAVKAIEALVRANLSVTPGDERLVRIARVREAAGDAARRAGRRA